MDWTDVTERIERAFPAAAPAGPLALLGEGFGSLAVETPGGMVFRMARHAAAGQAYAREWHLLPWIAPYLPVAVPRPVFYLESSPDFPHGVIGAPRLPGVALELAQVSAAMAPALAGQIGAIIAALQAVPLHTAPVGWLPVESVETRQAGWRRLRDQAMPALLQALEPEEYQRVVAWWAEFLADERMRPDRPVFQHGDLWLGNFLVADGQVVALLDFQEAGLGDPAQDFVPQLYLGLRFLEWVRAAYQQAGGAAGPHFEVRLRHLWALREFTGLVIAIQQGDREEFAESVEKLRRGPILSPLGMDGWRRFGSP